MAVMRSWPDFFDDVRTHAATYFSSEDIRQTYRNPAIEIDFDVDDLKLTVNAHARKHSPERYEIRIYAGLLAELDSYANSAFTMYPKLFAYDENRRAEQGRAASYLVFLWTDFVICHEWAHIVYGHLEVTGRSQWDEITDNDSLESPELRHALELEADSRATVFTLAGLATRWSDVSAQLYGKSDPLLAWRDYYHGLLLLFDFFEEKQKSVPTGRKTHPHPFVRAYTFQMFAIGERDRIEGLPEISTSDAQRFFAELAINYYMKVTKRDAQEYLHKSIQAAEFCSKIDEILASHGIADLRMAKSTART